MSAMSIDPTAWEPGPRPGDDVPVRRLSVAEYRRALHWAWHQDPEGRRIHDESTPQSPAPTPTPTPTPTKDGAAGPAAVAGGAAPVGGPGSDVWSPAQTITVTGMHGGAGSSTIALGLATAAATRGSTVLVDPAIPTVSGLACVATTELGVLDGWRLGTRAGLHIERRDGEVLPTARKHPDDLVVLDAGIQDLPGWEQVARTDGYRVLAATTTPASLLRLDTFLATDPECVAVLTRCPRITRRWRATLPPALAVAWDAGRVVPVREDTHLAQTGPSTASVPRHLVEAMHTVLARLP